MRNSNARFDKKVVPEEMSYSIDVLIERLRKIRALNGDPALFGIEGYIIKRLQFNKMSILTRS